MVRSFTHCSTLFCNLCSFYHSNCDLNRTMAVSIGYLRSVFPYRNSLLTDCSFSSVSPKNESLHIEIEHVKVLASTCDSFAGGKPKFDTPSFSDVISLDRKLPVSPQIERGMSSTHTAIQALPFAFLFAARKRRAIVNAGS